MKNTTTPPYLRGWYALQREEQQEYAARKRARYRTTIWVWLAVIIAGMAAIGMDSHQRQRQASYRALPSADEQLLRSHMTIEEVMAAQESAIRREYGKIAGERP